MPHIQPAVDSLNEAFKNDPKTMQELFSLRVACNANLANHPHVQVGFNYTGKVHRYTVGLLGIINGVVEPLTGEKIAAIYDDTYEGGKLMGFTKFVKK